MALPSPSKARSSSVAASPRRRLPQWPGISHLPPPKPPPYRPLCPTSNRLGILTKTPAFERQIRPLFSRKNAATDASQPNGAECRVHLDAPLRLLVGGAHPTSAPPLRRFVAPSLPSLRRYPVPTSARSAQLNPGPAPRCAHGRGCTASCPTRVGAAQA